MAPPKAATSNYVPPTGNGWGKKAVGIGGTLAALAAIGLAGGFFAPKLASQGKASSPGLQASGSTGKANLSADAQSGGPNLADATGGSGVDLASQISETAPALKAEVTNAPPALAVQSSAPAPTLAVNSGMPQDIHDWLEHLHRTESARNQVAQQQITQAMQTLTQMQAQKMSSAMDEDPSDDPSASLRNQASGLTSGLQASWNSLKSQFDAVQAPGECATAKSEYDVTLAATGQMMVELISAINSAAADPQAALTALRGMQGTSGNRIDTHAKATDSEVASICAHYQTSKWFSISGDVGDSSMLSKIGIE